MKNLQYTIKTCSFLLFFLMAFSISAQSTNGVLTTDDGRKVLLKTKKANSSKYAGVTIQMKEIKKAEKKAVDKQAILLDKKEYLKNRKLDPNMKKRVVLQRDALKKNSLKRNTKTNSN